MLHLNEFSSIRVHFSGKIIETKVVDLVEIHGLPVKNFSLGLTSRQRSEMNSDVVLNFEKHCPFKQPNMQPFHYLCVRSVTLQKTNILIKSLNQSLIVFV